MIRGTTPTHIFNIPLAASEIKEIKITYSQNGSVVLSKKKGDCEIIDNVVTVTLSQEDTFKFNSAMHVKIQMRVMTNTGCVMGSKTMTVSVDDCLDSEVLI